MSDNDNDKKRPTSEDLMATMDPATRARFLFIYKVVITAALLGVVAVTHKYGLGPGLVAAAVYTFLF